MKLHSNHIITYIYIQVKSLPYLGHNGSLLMLTPFVFEVFFLFTRNEIRLTSYQHHNMRQNHLVFFASFKNLFKSSITFQ